MKKIDLFIGFVIGIITAILGSFIFIKMFTSHDFMEGLKIMKSQGYLGKIITLGAILNIIAFFILLKLNKDLMANGVVLATIILTIITLLV